MQEFGARPREAGDPVELRLPAPFARGARLAGEARSAVVHVSGARQDAGHARCIPIPIASSAYSASVHAFAFSVGLMSPGLWSKGRMFAAKASACARTAATARGRASEGGIAKGHALRLHRSKGGLRTLRDQCALFLGQRGVKVQDERIDVRAEPVKKIFGGGEYLGIRTDGHSRGYRRRASPPISPDHTSRRAG